MDKQAISDNHWGERCSVKLDLLLSRVEKLSAMVFHLKGTFTTEDAAIYLGVTIPQFNNMVRKYGIPHSKIGSGRLFFSKEDLDNWLRTHLADETQITSECVQLQEQYY